MSSSTSTVTFQPWTRTNDEESSISNVLARVLLDRGHFRDMSEQSLQEEMAAEGALELSEDGSGEGDEADEDGNGERLTKAKEPGYNPPKTAEELMKARTEMIGHIAAAQQEIDYARDFVSLLISRDAPKRAIQTISPSLKEAVPLGSLAFDRWERIPVDVARERQDGLLATNVRMEHLQQSTDSLLAAATRLEGNVRRETQYWDQILPISGRGWNVSRMPGQRGKLGVRYGSYESSLRFSRRGIAALNVGDDGGVTLDGEVGRQPQGLQVTLRKKSETIGVSKLPLLSDNDATTLEARIRYARDSLYDEELYHELVRESRSLSSIGVDMRESTIRCPIADADIELSFNLVPLDTVEAVSPTYSGNRMAEAAAIVARLLLSVAHRETLKKRSEIPRPLSEDRKNEEPPKPILRPILSFMMHQTSIAQLNLHLDTVRRVLQTAQVEASFTKAQLQLPRIAEAVGAEQLISSFMQPWQSEADISITFQGSDETPLIFKAETTLARNFGTWFMVEIPTRKERHVFSELDEVVELVNVHLARCLARALAIVLGASWRCDELRATVTKAAGSGEDGQVVGVEFSCDSGTLSLSSAKGTVRWGVEGESSSRGFWEAWEEVVVA